MIGGIFETIGKTLGVGKEKYFLELDDAAEDSVKNIKQVAAKVAETAKEASAEVVEKAQELIDDTVDQAENSADKATDKAAATAKKAEKNAKVTAKAVEKKAKATTDKKATASKKSASSTKKVQADEVSANKPAPAQPTGPSEEDLIIAAIAATAKGKTLDAQGNVVEAEVTTFATDYLMTPSRSSRRRPGPSLSPFKDMAKDVNPRI